MENRREHYVETQRVKEYAKSLVYDLAQDTLMVRETIYRIKNALKRIDQFARFTDQKKIGDIRNLDIYASTVFIDGYRPYTWNRATLEQIKNSGSLRYFTNDTILNRISSYDAFTRHLDEDFKGDEQRSEKTMEMKAEIIDMNYPDTLYRRLRSAGDSVYSDHFLKSLGAADLALLTNDFHKVQILVNNKLIIKSALLIRSESELPELIKNAATLIGLLKDEYHLD